MPTSSKSHCYTALASKKAYRQILLALAIASIVLIGAYFLHLKQQQLLASAMKQYGESISHLITEHIGPQLANNDVISLQAASQNTVDSTAIYSLVIYDINNHILAQAVKDINQNYLNDIQHFTSPIISSNNIVGSATISITTALYQNQLGITPLVSKKVLGLLTIFILIGLLVLILVLKKTKSFEEKANKQEETTTLKTNMLDETTEQELSTQTLPSNWVTLTLSINNIDALYQQLNAELRIKQFSSLNADLQKVLQLYGGNVLSNTESIVVIGFQDTHKENILNAIYAGTLLLGLNKNSDHSIISLGLMIKSSTHYLNSEITHLSKHLDNAYRYQPGNAEIMIDKTLYEEFSLQDKIDIANEHQPIISITNLNKQCQSLINKQLNQLQ